MTFAVKVVFLRMVADNVASRLDFTLKVASGSTAARKIPMVGFGSNVAEELTVTPDMMAAMLAEI